MSIAVLNKLPAWEQAKWDDKGSVAPMSDSALWSGKAPPPAIGKQIVVKVNNIGPVIVEGYFIEDKWMGIAVKLLDPPEWQKKTKPQQRSWLHFWR